MIAAFGDRLTDALRSTRAQWGTSLGALSALVALLANGGTLDSHVAASALALLALGLLAQLRLNARATLRRERRLVEAAAVLRMQSALLEEIARSDAVTGIANRRGLDG